MQGVYWLRIILLKHKVNILLVVDTFILNNAMIIFKAEAI